MEKEDYAKSIFDYQDVKDTIEFERDRAREEGRVEGEAIGEARGRAEGETITKLAMAKGMLEKGIDLNTIVSITGLSVEEIVK